MNLEGHTRALLKQKCSRTQKASITITSIYRISLAWVAAILGKIFSLVLLFKKR